MLDASSKKGLRIYENTKVIDVKYDEGGVTAETIYGHKVKGKILMVATGYNTELFTKRAFGTKTTAFNIATKPIKNIEDIYKEVVIRDNETTYNYFRTTSDDRLILGFLGKDPNNQKLWYCLGYGANGILFAILGGIMLSKLYLGEAHEDLKLFKVNRFD